MSSATERQVRRVQIPSEIVKTETFHPIRHGVILDTVYDGLQSAGLKIAVDDNGEEMKRFTLLDDGAKMFGTLTLDSDIVPGTRMMIGVRNSFNRTLAALLAFGSHVMVCSNGCVFAERVIGRKHTTNIMSDLPFLMEQGLAQVDSYRQQQEDFFNRLKEVEMTDSQAHDFILRAARDRKAITAGDIVNVADQWHNPRYDDFKEHGDKTAWVLHNAFTDVYTYGGGNKSTGVSGRNGVAFSERATRLSGMFVEEFAGHLDLEPTVN